MKGRSRIVYLSNPSALNLAKRKAYMQDPVARVLLDVCSPESPGFTQALAELLNLRSYDIPITSELVRKVGEKFAKYHPVPFVDVPESEHCDLVYYARIGNRVKIGWTANLKKRMDSINPEELLIVEPGGVEVERIRHVEFKHLNTHGEWFRYQGLLVFHVEKMKEAAAKRALVDTAALAAHLGCTPQFVAKLVKQGVIAPTDTQMTGKTGRPAMQFDIGLVDHAMRAFRLKLDQGTEDV